MIASLPMYDRPEVQGANDRFWHLIHSHLGKSPTSLTRDGDVWDHWTSPDLLLSQTCGLPYRKTLNGKVNLVGTPIHDLPCPPGRYFSVVLVRADDPRTSLADFDTIAINSRDSQSGWAALWKLAKDQSITLGSTTLTGGHQASARAVATGKADLAALDVVTWRMIQRYDAFARDLRVLAKTVPTPALPFITALDPTPVRAAIAKAIQALDPEDSDALCLKGIADIPNEVYMQLPIPSEPCLSSEKP